MKKRIWTITPYFLIFSVLSLVMAAVSFNYNKIISIIEVCVSLFSIIIILYHYFHFKKYINSLIESALSNLNAIDHNYIEQFKFPVVVIGDYDEIIWYNSRFLKAMETKTTIIGHPISSYISNAKTKSIVNSEGTNVKCGNRKFTAFGNVLEKGTIIFLVDDTYYKEIEKNYKERRSCVALVVFDNRDDFVNDNEEESAQIILNVESTLQKWACTNNALYKKLSGNRYMIVFEEKEIKKLIDTKFKILDEVRNISLNDRAATISMGIGRNNTSLRDSEASARKALDMALGRGGDQVAIMKDGSYEFFGGVAQGTEKRSKVRTRVIAEILSKAIKESDNVLIMGHRFSDLDCVGSAIAMCDVISKAFSKPANIVIDIDKSMAKPLLNRYIKENTDKIFIHPYAASSMVNSDTLLIIVDTHSPSFLESEEIYEKCNNVVVIDHHRKMVNYITNTIVFYHEPTASSTAEMCSELIGYIGNDVITKANAEGLLAGIMLDTKNFVVKTGVRTFEAAAYLREKGADTVSVKKLFADNIDTYKAKYSLVLAAEIYNGCAITLCSDEIKETRLIAAQAADELLTIDGVTSSFVIFVSDNTTANISARSFGLINVQVIMEKLGGGGHQTMAAAQLKNTTLEQAKELLQKAINEVIS